MFPFRHSSLFKNRWFALLWAGGICWSAVQIAQPSDDDASIVSGADLQQMNEAVALLEQAGK